MHLIYLKLDIVSLFLNLLIWGLKDNALVNKANFFYQRNNYLSCGFKIIMPVVCPPVSPLRATEYGLFLFKTKMILKQTFVYIL